MFSANQNYKKENVKREGQLLKHAFKEIFKYN